MANRRFDLSLGRGARGGALLAFVVVATIVALDGARLTAREKHARRFECTPQAVDRIAADTFVNAKTPDGWDALVIKIVPRLGRGDADNVLSIVKENAGLLSTVILAKRREAAAGPPPVFAIDRVAVGFAVASKGGHVVVTSEKPGNLGLIQRQLLSAAEATLPDVKRIAQSDTLVLVDLKGILRRGTEHVDMTVRHAVLVDNRDGAFYSLFWAIERDADGNYGKLLDEPQWLSLNRIEDNVLYVDANEITLGIPSKRAFAIAKPPTGTALRFSPRLRELAAQPRFNEQSLHELELGSWDAVFAARRQEPGHDE